jgi:hypothetical protein
MPTCDWRSDAACSTTSVLFEEEEAGAGVLAKDRRHVKNQDGDWFSQRHHSADCGYMTFCRVCAPLARCVTCRVQGLEETL